MAFISGKLYRNTTAAKLTVWLLGSLHSTTDVGPGKTVLYLGRTVSPVGINAFVVMTGTGDIGYVYGLCYFEEVGC